MAVKKSDLEKDCETIQQLGGPAKLAQALGLNSLQVVANWKTHGISKVGRYQIRDYAARVKITLPTDFMTRSPTPRR